MSLVVRPLRWLRAHAYVGDVAGTLCLILVFAFAWNATFIQYGLLFFWPETACRWWSVAVLLPFALRSARPRLAVAIFEWMVAFQLLFGPALLVADVAGLYMLYWAVLRAPDGHTKRPIVIAVLLCAACAAISGWTTIFGSLSSLWRAQPVGIPYCSGALLGRGPWSACEPYVNIGVGSAVSLLILFLACVAASVTIAFWKRARMLTARLLKERNEAILARDAEERLVAANAERARIARDMHDMVAHTLSTIIVQADGGRYAAAHNVALAEQTMTTIMRESERALANMDELLTTFRTSDDVGYEHIGALVDLANRTDAMQVSWEVDGEARADMLSDEAGVACYRLVQEALSNVRKHAGAHARVWIREMWDGDKLRIHIHDDGGERKDGAAAAPGESGPGVPSHGFGLLGMRERLEHVGGTVNAGPDSDGGFTIDATIPLASAATAVEPLAVVQRDVARHHRLNWVERLSALGQRHPLAMDIAMALVLVIGMVFVDSNVMLWGREYAPPSLWAILGPCLMVLPLSVRRTMPQTSAALVAAGAFVEILVFPTIGFESVAAIIASFSVSLYAPRRALRWVVPVIGADGLLLAVRAYGESLGYTTLLDLVTGNVTRNVSQGAVEPYMAAVVMGGVALLLCYAAVLRGRWHRIGDRNAYVLQERERELLRTQQQHRVQAANEERNRIASGLQQEVTDTLLHVRQRARDGLTMIETVGQGATGEPIRQAFQSIADQGRQALARMRELLRVLRQTGLTGQVSDEQRARMTAPLQPVQAQGERQETQ